MTSEEENLYGISWSNPAWSHLLCAANVLDYFCDLSNPFYDRQCNNEVIRMQRLSAEQLLCMTGVEFYLHHAQEPILFIIRKQQRLTSTQVTPLAYYYIINGTVLQAPDLTTLLSSRLLTTVNSLNKILQTLAPCARYHPSDGSYSWDDPNTLLGLTNVDAEGVVTPVKSGQSSKSEQPPANLFQVQRADFLLAEWANRFPLPSPTFANAVSGASFPASTVAMPVTTSSHSISLPGTIKEEPTTGESLQMVRPSVKPTVLPPNVPVPGSFPSSPQMDKKPRV
ncbi:Mediator of RNA polymerase II transcription subunit 6 [Clonorchis sinensis]|uniref:Mediator of RNA polymerase II transcription subunit 6 n=2 Tax=Clonorchis sinensis TaxID=79923 RepID=A0A8T1MYF2_CLOSI|nr:Mediator of RNA polymerase II transcription subunit 6 [Clonorchis sinensis]GAA48777.1 mediator of RNA polymerase II transcription subunit 6 [Clonorchis sinensis]